MRDGECFGVYALGLRGRRAQTKASPLAVLDRGIDQRMQWAYDNVCPQLTLGPLLGGGVRMSEEAAEVSRWFGCMVFAFGSVPFGRALYDGRAGKPIWKRFSLATFATLR